MADRWFHRKGLTSFLVFASFFIMSVTGLVLYFTPPGRVAYWVDWRLAGLTKTHWDNIHIISSLLFVVAAVYHLVLNWKVFANYVVDRLRERVRMRKELLAAASLSVVVVVGSIVLFPPFNYVIDLSGYLKGAWIASSEYEPPFGHAERLSLDDFAGKMGMEPARAAGELRAKGIRFASPKERLEEIARSNGISPMELYLMIRKFEPKAALPRGAALSAEDLEVVFAGKGAGRMSLRGVLEETGMDPALARRRLEGAGLVMDEQESMRHAAERSGLAPIEILKVILVEGYVAGDGK